MSLKLDWAKCEGMIPAVVQHADTGAVLMLAYMNEESLRLTQESGNVTFFSRSRNQLWTKGETSGNFLKLVSLAADCDGDTILVQAKPQGPVCHTGTETCFDSVNTLGAKSTTSGSLEFLQQLTQVIDSRFAAHSTAPNEKSYVASLIRDGVDRMAQKVGEEAIETVIAAKNQDLAAFEGEAADLLFHLMVLCRAKGASLDNLTAVLKSRHK